MTQIIIPIQSNLDDQEWYLGALRNTTFLFMGSHGVESNGAWTGFRFPVTAALAAINPNTINSVVLRVSAHTSASMRSFVRVEPGNAPAWANTVQNRPRERYQTISSTGQIAWVDTFTSPLWYDSPDLKALVIPALHNLVQNNHLGVIVGTNQNATMQVVQILSFDHVSVDTEPRLVINHTPASRWFDGTSEETGNLTWFNGTTEETGFVEHAT